ncbi:MAG: adenosine deaminase, partial [Armatimonadetes bacterium]|nr:adenosine deaminase [Armatimonadota bacterium]
MPVHYELHRHLGGAIVPRVFWRYLHRKGHILSTRFPRYEMLERYMTRPRSSLVDYLQLHRMVEGVQRLEALPYFVSKLVRGAYVFENIEYLELRYTPYLRTSESSAKENRLQQMEEVVDIIAEAARLP